MWINERIKELRDRDKLTQVDLAEKLNCNRQKIADWERGKSTPSVDDIILLTKIFDISADYLLGLTETATPDTDIQAICKYTGLNESAVSTLCELHEPLNILHLVPQDIVPVINFLINDMNFRLTDESCTYRSGSILPRMLDYLRCAGSSGKQQVYVTQNGKIFESKEKAREEAHRLPADIKEIYPANAADLSNAAFYNLLTDAIKSAKERYRGESHGNNQETE